MFSKIRKRFTYANVAMTLALVFAMSGGAYAAKHYLITSTKQISPKVLKALKGANGKNGAAGANGANGAQGLAGAAGAKGETGAAGSPGAGTEGKEGKTGATGKEGSPWVAGGTLPSKKSEEGEWSALYEATKAQQPASVSISYSIPLEVPPALHFIGANQELAGEKNEAPAIKEGKCKGSAEAPEAAPGNLCVFTNEASNEQEWVFFGPSRFGPTEGAGTALFVASEEAGLVLANGTWAVTAA